VEFVDVYPTLSDLCGLPLPGKLEGSSLKSYLEDPSQLGTDVAISQYPRRDSQSGTDLMGYSIRDSRWRATFWRERNGSKILATELYDEVNDPNETVSVAHEPAHKELLESLARHLPPVGSSAIDNAEKIEKGTPKRRGARKAAP
jgi:iduronate 2-sulfatase